MAETHSLERELQITLLNMKNWKWIVIVLVVIALMFMAFQKTSASNSVTVCHSDQSGWDELTINENALQAHLNHGDFVVDEDNPCPPEEEEPIDLCPEEGVQTELPCAEPPAEDLCPEEGIQTELPCEEVTEPPTEPPTQPSSNGGSGHRSSSGVVWCTATRTTFCRPLEGFTPNNSVDNSALIENIKQRIEILREIIRLKIQLNALLNSHFPQGKG